MSSPADKTSVSVFLLLHQECTSEEIIYKSFSFLALSTQMLDFKKISGKLVLFCSIGGNWQEFVLWWEKWENNAANFYMAHDSVHSLIHSCSFSLSNITFSQDNLINHEELPDSWKKVKNSIIKSEFQKNNIKHKMFDVFQFNKIYFASSSSITEKSI